MKMLHKLKLLPLPLILTGLSACATGLTVQGPIKGDYCRIAQPITYDSKQDTTATVAAIEKHNSQWVCVCEHDCPVQGK